MPHLAVRRPLVDEQPADPLVSHEHRPGSAAHLYSELVEVASRRRPLLGVRAVLRPVFADHAVDVDTVVNPIRVPPGPFWGAEICRA